MERAAGIVEKAGITLVIEPLNLLMNITEHLDRIGHFHAAGNPGRTEITKGEIHYRHLFETLERMNYDGYMGLEYMAKEDPVKGLVETRETVLV